MAKQLFSLRRRQPSSDSASSPEVDVELETLQQALQSIPEVQDGTAAEGGDVADLLGVAAEFSKLLRKLGVQQTREVRELLDALQVPGAPSEQVREAWQREQQRAAGSEQQLRRVSEVLIGTFDILERMLAAMEAQPGMREWEEQTRQAIDLCLHNAQKVGLVPLGAPGEPFDVAIHNLTREVPRGYRGPVRVGAVVTRGYALNGKVLRRAAVDYAS